jgi:hypothetical protein
VPRDASGTELALLTVERADAMERAYDDQGNDHAVRAERTQPTGPRHETERRPPILETRELEACDGTVQREEV